MRKLDIPKEAVESALRECSGQVRLAALTLGMPRSTLYDAIRRHKLEELVVTLRYRAGLRGLHRCEPTESPDRLEVICKTCGALKPKTPSP